MRNMTYHKLCSVCNEAIWLNFLRKVSLIDKLEVKENSVNLTTLRLGQFRETKVLGESLEISWYHNGTEINDFQDLTQIELDREKHSGRWEVKVELKTLEVRNDPQRYLVDKKKFKFNVS